MNSHTPCHAIPPSETTRTPASRRVRWCGLIQLVLCGLPLATAALLTPRDVGYGTHRQFDLPSCSFMVRHGLPCPTCGATTAFAAAVEGRFDLAVRASVFGMLLAVAAAVLALTGAWQLVTGRPVVRALQPRWWWVIVALLAALLCWGATLAIGWNLGTLPVR